MTDNTSELPADDYVPICEKCGAPATQNRTERKTLSGYGTAAQSRVVHYALCDAHALEYDVAHMADAALTGGPIPVPPSQAMRDGALSPVDFVRDRIGTGDGTLPEWQARLLDDVTRDQPPHVSDLRCAPHLPQGIVGTPAHGDSLDDPLRAWADRTAAAGLALPPHVLDDFQRLAERAQGDAPTPQISGVALDDQQSADAGGTWESVIGICFLAMQIDPDKLRELVAEYERTAAVMNPRLFDKIRANVNASRAITQSLIALQTTIAQYGGAAFSE